MEGGWELRERGRKRRKSERGGGKGERGRERLGERVK